MKIIEDSILHPDLFHWNSQITPQELEKWLKIKNIKVDKELFDFWCQTGGGDLFESETIHGPWGNKELVEDLESVNKYYWQKGMPKNYLLIHEGIANTVIEMNTFQYIVTNEEFIEIVYKYSTFSEWYEKYLRFFFQERYNLI